MMPHRPGGKQGVNSLAGTGSRFTIASKTLATVLPGKASFPVDISYSTAPKENRSVRVSSGSPFACSGDI